MSFFLYFICVIIIYCSKNSTKIEENDKSKNNFNNNNNLIIKEKENRKLQNKEFQKFRIEIDTSMLARMFNLPMPDINRIKSDQDLIMSSIGKAKEYLLKLVGVEKSNDKISISKSEINSSEFTLDEEIYDKEYDCDLVIFVTGGLIFKNLDSFGIQIQEDEKKNKEEQENLK